MDVPAPGFGAVCGACPEGYTGGEAKCYGMQQKIQSTWLYVFGK